jgi:hypothetical protein
MTPTHVSEELWPWRMGYCGLASFDAGWHAWHVTVQLSNCSARNARWWKPRNGWPVNQSATQRAFLCPAVNGQARLSRRLAACATLNQQLSISPGSARHEACPSIQLKNHRKFMYLPLGSGSGRDRSQRITPTNTGAFTGRQTVFCTRRLSNPGCEPADGTHAELNSPRSSAHKPAS